MFLRTAQRVFARRYTVTLMQRALRPLSYQVLRPVLARTTPPLWPNRVFGHQGRLDPLCVSSFDANLCHISP
jgi:hypothetical protein